MATKNLGKVAFVFKGDYSDLTPYDKYDVTFDGESSFLSTIENNLGHPLSDTNYWKPLCKGNYLAISGKADKTTSVIAGAGLTGGGTLDSDRTLNVASANDGITVNADNIQLNTVNNLTSTSTTQPLAANQGTVLKGEITQLGADLNTLVINKIDNILSNVTWNIGRVYNYGIISNDYGNAYSYTDIAVPKGSAINYSLIADTNTAIINKLADGVYTLISYGTGTYKTCNYFFEEDATIRVCVFTAYISSSKISQSSSGTIQGLYDNISDLNLNINAIEEDTSNIKKSIDYGKKESIIGLNNSDISIVNMSNSLLKSVELLSEPTGYTAGCIRLRQIYCLSKNGSSVRWVNQLYYINCGTLVALISCNIDFWSKPTTDDIIFENAYVKVTWNAQELWNYPSVSATSYLLDSTIDNPYKVHLISEDKYFDGNSLLEKSIDESKFSDVVVAKLNKSSSDNGFLTGKKIATICDSLGSGGYWQTKLAALSGAIFDNEKNYQHYSYGGTPTLNGGDNDGQTRAKLLVDEGLIIPDIIIIQNVNDSLGTTFQNVGTPLDESYFCIFKRNVVISGLSSTIAAKYHWDNNFSTIISAFTPYIGSMLKVPYTSTAYTLKITSIAGVNGSLIISLGDSESKTIPVETTDSIEDIIDKINIIAFPNYSHYKNGSDSVIFTYKGVNTPSINIDNASTGVANTIVTGTAETSRNYCFVSHDISNWSMSSKWLCANSPDENDNITLMSVYKGLVEYLQTNFPNAFIYWFFPKCYSFDYTSPTYKRADGTFDVDKILTQATYGSWIFNSQKTFCDYYQIPYLDIRSESCITPINIATYFNPNDVHPKLSGYEKWGEALFRLLC